MTPIKFRAAKVDLIIVYCVPAQVHCQLTAVSMCNTWSSQDKPTVLYNINKWWYARRSIYHGRLVWQSLVIPNLVMPNSDPRDRNFCSYLTAMKDTYILQTPKGMGCSQLDKHGLFKIKTFLQYFPIAIFLFSHNVLQDINCIAAHCDRINLFNGVFNHAQEQNTLSNCVSIWSNNIFSLQV